MSRPAPDPTLGVRDLLAAGLPDGPLARASRFYAAQTGTKLHSDSSCGRLRGGTVLRAYDFRQATADVFCTTCANGPTDTDQVTYIKAGHTVAAARRAIASLRTALIGDSLGRPLSADAPEDEPHRALALNLASPVVVRAATWHRVTQAHVVVAALDEILADPQVHPDMVEHMADVEVPARKLLAQLRAVAGGDDPLLSLQRSCVIDLMSTYRGYSDTTPANGRPQLKSRDSYAALLRGSYSTADGVADVILDAWKLWREQVRATGDFVAARQVVAHATKIDTLEPSEISQLGRGPARTPAPSSGSVWDWQVAEWRLDAHDALARVCAEWEEVFTEQLSAAQAAEAEVVSLRVADSAPDKTNASTQLLIQLPTVRDAARKVTLVLAPGVAARWLEKFGTRGAVQQVNAGQSPGVKSELKVPAGIDPSVLRAALNLWTGTYSTAQPTYARAKTDKMASLQAAIEAAAAVVA